jgi:hypothetical protein
MKRNMFAAVLLVTAAVVIISCSAKSGQNLVGTWQGTNGVEKIEFLNNKTFRGTMIWDIQKTPVELSGTYAMKGDLLDLKVEKPESLTPMTWKVTFSGNDRLTFLYQQGGTLKLDGTSADFQHAK